MPTLTIAKLTIKDLVRRRVFVILGLFAAGMVLLSFPLRQLTIGQWYHLIVDVGLGATDFSATLIAILLGATLVAGDLDKRTLYPLLAKPISRASFVAGRFLGLGAVIALLALGMATGTALMLTLANAPKFIPVIQATGAIIVNGWVLGAIALMFSSFTSATLAGTVSLALALIGHLTDNLAYFGHRTHPGVSRAVMVGLSRALPDLELLNLKTLASHGLALPWAVLAIRFSYGLVYASLAVAIGALVFSRRDLK